MEIGLLETLQTESKMGLENITFAMGIFIRENLKTMLFMVMGLK